MNKHTPGPWYANQSGLIYAVSDDADESILICDVEGMDPDYPNRAWQPVANARLIAAAPDLLAALEEMLPMWSSGIEEPWVLRARAAIARATGDKT